MILITGATGEYGKTAIQFLLDRAVNPDDVNAFVRNEGKAADIKAMGVKLRIGSYDDYDSMVKAFSNIDKLLFVSSNDIPNRSQQHENVVKAAKEAGIKHIVYTSFDRKSDNPDSPISFVEKAHVETEKWIKESGIPYTILRNTLYTDFIPVFLGDRVTETGPFFPAGTTKTAFATRSNMAEASTVILTTEGHENKEYVFSNTEGVSFSEIAQFISEACGKDLNYTDPDAATYRTVLSDAGLPDENIQMVAGFAEAIKQGIFSQTSTDLEKLLGRKPETVKAFLSKFYAPK